MVQSDCAYYRRLRCVQCPQAAESKQVPAGARRNGRAVVRGRGRGRGSATAAAASATGRGTYLRNQRPAKQSQTDDTGADAGRGHSAEESGEGGSSSSADEPPPPKVCLYGAWVATNSTPWDLLSRPTTHFTNLYVMILIISVLDTT